MNQAIELNPENLNIAHWKSPREFDLPVCDVEQIRQVEHTAFEKIDSFLMMQAAGFRTAQHIIQEVAHRPEGKPRFLVLAGPGNNGGDACLVAGKLHVAGFPVTWVQIKSDKPASKDRQQAEAWCRSVGLVEQGLQTTEQNLQAIDQSLQHKPSSPDASSNPILRWTPANTWIVDGLLGIGCDRPPSALLETLIQGVNQARSTRTGIRVLALDCPSGLDCSTGLTPGAAIQADSTYTYIALKTGLLCNQGKDLTGELRVESLGCEAIVAATQPCLAQGDTSLKAMLPRRKHNHHKGSFGSLAVIGGAPGMVGAAVLAARTAIQLGAGRVALSLISELDQRMPDVQVQGIQPYLDPLFPELMNKSLDDNFDFSDCLVVGPGMGESFDSVQTLHRIVEEQSHKPMVWDADALNLLAAHTDLQEKLIRARTGNSGTGNSRTGGSRTDGPIAASIAAPLVMTPHPLEAARLLGSTSQAVNSDRVKAAQTLANRFQCTVVLKGAGTVITHAENQSGHAPRINCTGGPMLATAGSGDVLAGVIGALIGQTQVQTLATSQAQAQAMHQAKAQTNHELADDQSSAANAGFSVASLAVWLHGLACEALPEEKYAPAICSASGLILRIQAHLNRLIHEN